MVGEAGHTDAKPRPISRAITTACWQNRSRGPQMSSMSRLISVVTLLLCAGLQPVVAAAPSCLPPIEIPHARIVRVEHNGVLVLEDGRAAELEGLILPAGASDHAPQLFADQTIAALGELATSRTMSSRGAGTQRGSLRKTARAGAAFGWRRRALVAASDFWNEVSRACRSRRIETNAQRICSPPNGRRARKSGYLGAGRLSRSHGVAIGKRDRDIPDCRRHGPKRRQQRRTRIPRIRSRSAQGFRSDDYERRSEELPVDREFDPFSYQNRTIRVRGWIDRVRRPEMEVATPGNIEVVESPTLRGSISAPQ